MGDDAEGHPLKGLRLKWRRTEAGSLSGPANEQSTSSSLFRSAGDVDVVVHESVSPDVSIDEADFRRLGAKCKPQYAP